MTERILVSPGVFTREFDGTIRPADPAGVATAIVSKREKGPAFEPTLVKDIDEDEQLFGKPSTRGDDFGAYTARSFLKVGSQPTMQVRLLGRSDTGIAPGYSVTKTYALVASGSNVVALIQASGTVALAGTLTSSSDQLALNIQNYQHITCSLHRSSEKYIGKVLNTDPSQFHTKKHTLFALYDYANKSTSENVYTVTEVIGLTSWTDDYITGAATTVISQPFDTVEYELFGIGSRFAGDSANSEIKVSIRDLKKSPNEGVYPYGTFTLLVRRYNDNDKSLDVLESFSNLSLDPESPNYVCRRVGDSYRIWNSSTKKFDEFGEYENKSKYIFIAPSIDLKNGNVPETALPYGFNGYPSVENGAFSGHGSFPDLPTVKKLQYKNDFSTRVYWGVEVVHNNSGSLNYGVLDRVKHLPSSFRAASGSTGSKFSLKWLSASVALASGFTDTTRLTDLQISALSTSLSYSVNAETSPVVSSSAGFSGYLSLANIENTELAKFTMVIHDGFDGLDITKTNPLDSSDMATVSTYQTLAFRSAIDMLSNGDEFEISELVIPGIWADKVVSYGIDMVENRGDTFYIADISGATVSDVVDQRTSLNYDSSYVGVYYPWVRINDDVNNKQVEVPPTVIVPAAFAYSDAVSFPWFAVAGMNRGGLKRFGVVKAKDKLKKSEQDKLYDNGINPIKSFPGEGPVIWGQKTLQLAASALDRINVRRMLLRTRKLIAKLALGIVFEPNVPAVWDRFVNLATPELERIRQNFGIDDFRLILDERTTTEDLIERNIMYGKIAIKPTRAAEFILLDFFVTNNAAGFEL